MDPKIAGYPFSRDIAPTLFQKRNRPSNSKIILIPIHGIGLIQTPSWANPHAAQDSFADPRSDSDGRNLVIRTTKYFAGVVAPSDSSSLAFVAGGVGKCWEGFKKVKILFGVPAMFQFFRLNNSFRHPYLKHSQIEISNSKRSSLSSISAIFNLFYLGA